MVSSKQTDKLCKLIQTKIQSSNNQDLSLELTGAGSLHLREEFLFDGIHQLRPEVPWMQHDLVVQGNVVEHSEFTFCK